MPKRAVLNLKNFSIGKTSSMASLLVPTEDLIQDVYPYDAAKEFTGALVPDDHDTCPLEYAYKKIESETYTGHSALVSALRWASELSPELKREWADSGFTNFLFQYMSFTRKFRYYSWVHQNLITIKGLLESAYDGSSITKETITEQLRKALDTRFWYSYTDSWAIVSWWRSTSETLTKEFEPIFVTESDRIPIELLDASLMALQPYIDEIEYSKLSEESSSFSEMQAKQFEEENKVSHFFFLLRSALNLEDMNIHASEEEVEEEKQVIKGNISNEFESLRFVYNQHLLSSYCSTAVELPYFLDLGAKDATKISEQSDTSGAGMHSITREYTKADTEQLLNYTLGDMHRIRDMFRVDKLNKKSAFESQALYPGVSGSKLDDAMEREDVVSRLVQDEEDDAGVVGTAVASSGIYMLVESNDSASAVLKSTGFSNTTIAQPTNTFTSYKTDSELVDYIQARLIQNSIGLNRIYANASDLYSSSNDFLSWYRMFNDAVTVYPEEVYTDNSLVYILGKGSYRFFPSKTGIVNINGIYEDVEYSEDDPDPVSLALPSTGFELKASIGDKNYVNGVKRGVDVEIPYNRNSQYTYFAFTLFHHQSNLLSHAKNMRMSLEISLDDDAPVIYYLDNPNTLPDNLDTTNGLYESLIEAENFPPVTNTPSSIVLKVGNDLERELPHILHLAVSANYPELSSSAPDLTVKGYKDTYVLLSGLELITKDTPQAATYGNYNEYRNSQGLPLNDYWNLSRSFSSIPFQHLLEIPHTIKLQNKALSSNYQTADLFSDVIVAKNHMDSEYKMQISPNSNDLVVKSFRHYTGVDSCSGTVALYFDCNKDIVVTPELESKADENNAKIYSISQVKDSQHQHSTELKYKRIETIKSINRFTQAIKHKSNLFSVIVRNTNADETKKENALAPEAYRVSDEDIEREKDGLKKIISSMVRSICSEYAPAHNQLFDVYFEQ